MDVLTISSAHMGAQIGVVRDGVVVACETLAVAHGLAAVLPACLAGLLDGRDTPGLVAAVTGPGSFTGLRAGLSVAHGVALGWGVPLIGVTVAEALCRSAWPHLDGRRLWVALAARAGHVFLDREGVLTAWPEGGLPPADGRIAVAGDAANVVVAALAARNADVKLLSQRAAGAVDIADVALARSRGELSATPALPLYGEAALARRAPAGRGAPA